MTAPPPQQQHHSTDAPMMVVFHDALRRDLVRLARSTAGDPGRHPGRRPGLEAGWALFKTHLHLHHTAEDTSLWPRMRDHLEGRDDDLELLDAMEAEHAEIDVLLDAVDAALADVEDRTQVHDAVNAFSDGLLAHLGHEESDTVPLMDSVLTPADWSAFHESQRRVLGIRGFAQLLPWLLDDAPPGRIAQVMGSLPRPIRFVHRRFWQPGYARRGLWAPDGSSS